MRENEREWVVMLLDLCAFQLRGEAHPSGYTVESFVTSKPGNLDTIRRIREQLDI